MAIAKKIIKYLDDNKYKYEMVEHKTTYTAWDTAQTSKIKPQEVAKTLVMKADRDYFLAVVSGNRNIDKKKLLKIYNIFLKSSFEKTVDSKGKKIKVKISRKVDFAKEAWMKKNLIGKVGATTPFGKILKMPVFIDNLLLKNKNIYLGSGDYNSSIKVGVKQYLKIEEPVKGSFSIKK